LEVKISERFCLQFKNQSIFPLVISKQMSGTKYDISSDLVKESFKSLEQIKVNIPSENKAGDCPVYLVKNKETKKGLVIIQEWWGCEEGILGKGKFFSTHGFSTLV
jgi:hypothetical protein